jgi:hypothetical protein
VAGDGAVPADDDVLLQFRDRLAHALPPEDLPELSLDDERRHRRGEVDQDAHPEDEQDHGEDPAGRVVVERDDLPVAHRGQGDDGHVQRVEDAVLALRDDGVAGHPDREDDQRRRRGGQQPAPDLGELFLFLRALHPVHGGLA